MSNQAARAVELALANETPCVSCGKVISKTGMHRYKPDGLAFYACSVGCANEYFDKLPSPPR